MSRDEKLVERFKGYPKDFTFDEAVKLLRIFGFVEQKSGKTSGSAVRFRNEEKRVKIKFHKPHPEKTLKRYVLDLIYGALVDCGFSEIKKQEDEQC